MQMLRQMLENSDDAVLLSAAMAWGLSPVPTQPEDIIDMLEAQMLSVEHAERMWDNLTDGERQALQTLLGSKTTPMFLVKRMFGELRKMGRGQVIKDEPHKKPASVTEALYYRGFIGEMTQMTNNGAAFFAYVPEDLALVLPKHKTAYQNLEDEPDEFDDDDDDEIEPLDASQLQAPQPADTSIVDDLTTLLAFLQLHTPAVEGNTLNAESVQALMPFLLRKSAARLAFLVLIGYDAKLIDARDGHLYTNRTEARTWLSAPRVEQLRTLINTWLDSQHYGELWHLPDITPEQLHGYDPCLARQTVLARMKEDLPEREWWDLDEFIHAIQEKTPDFQRPNGDYEAWYITDIGGEYLKGFESWDTVEGVQIEFIIMKPMHWLGLVDVAPEAARLTAFGRGVVGLAAFPNPPMPDEPILVEPDGTLRVSRRASRVDRFQIARFATWQAAPTPQSGEPFTYTLDMRSISQADAQGINTGHISAFLKRLLNDAPLPEPIEKLLKNWQKGDLATVTLEQLIVLRTLSEDVLDNFMNTPELRRFFGARLGKTAVVVRADQWQALQSALSALGIHAEAHF